MENAKTNVKMTETKKIKGKFFKNLSKFVGTSLVTMSMIPTVFAADGDKGTSPGEFATNMLSYAWWIIYGICGVFAALGVIKMIQGQADEDTRARNNGITTLIVAAAGILVVSLIKGQV